MHIEQLDIHVPIMIGSETERAIQKGGVCGPFEIILPNGSVVLHAKSVCITPDRVGPPHPIILPSIPVFPPQHNVMHYKSVSGVVFCMAYCDNVLIDMAWICQAANPLAPPVNGIGEFV